MDKKIFNDQKTQEAFERFASEIRNKTFAEAYIAVEDCVDQKEFCKRIGLNESRFSRVIRKYKNLPTNKRPDKEDTSLTA